MARSWGDSLPSFFLVSSTMLIWSFLPRWKREWTYWWVFRKCYAYEFKHFCLFAFQLQKWHIWKLSQRELSWKGLKKKKKKAARINKSALFPPSPGLETSCFSLKIIQQIFKPGPQSWWWECLPQHPGEGKDWAHVHSRHSPAGKQRHTDFSNPYQVIYLKCRSFSWVTGNSCTRAMWKYKISSKALKYLRSSCCNVTFIPSNMKCYGARAFEKKKEKQLYNCTPTSHSWNKEIDFSSSCLGCPNSVQYRDHPPRLWQVLGK